MDHACIDVLALTAEDIMSRDLLLIPRQMSLPAAAKLLRREQVSGAPVVDEKGACIGVITATDFLRWAESGRSERGSVRNSCYCEDWQLVEPDRLPQDLVESFMTRDPVTAPPTERIGPLARKMVDAHVHRVVIVDSEGRPMGIVTSTDILAALARAEATRDYFAGNLPDR